MYTTENYVWGLVAYILGVLMLTPVLWWATRGLRSHPVKAFFRILILTILLTPAFAYQNMNYLAPAWVVSVFEVIKPQSEEGIWRGILPIGLSFTAIYIIYLSLWFRFHKRSDF